MGICALSGIFQAIVDNLFGDIKGIKTYIDDILVLRKEGFFNHTEQLRKILGRLRAASLKLNAPKFSLGLK